MPPPASAPARPRVTVAVVSWNTRELLLRCLRSLAPEAERGLAQVWVLDNASSDGSLEAARGAAPWARVVAAGANLGFGAAVNRVARETESEWLACANADVAIEPGALEALLSAGAEARIGCVAPRLVLPDGSTQHSVQPFLTIPLALWRNLGLNRLSPRLADQLCLEGAWNSERPREVPWAIGAFLLLRREAFDAVGGFDERQWMYAEDLDLGWRLRDAGWITRYEPRARVLHEGAAATSRAFGERRAVRFMAATYAVLARRRGLVRTWITAAIGVLGAGGRIAWMTPLATVSRRWRGPRDLSRVWFRAHLQGLRPRSKLLRDDR
jgi:N-acetylglucosaminyl-diphospho-decaprenol L-rhamnosyltransferase